MGWDLILIAAFGMKLTRNWRWLFVFPAGVRVEVTEPRLWRGFFLEPYQTRLYSYE